MKLPAFTWLPGYDRRCIRGDVVAGLTVWAVLVPESLAYATIAGVSPVVGLYAAPGALLLYAAFGSSRQLVVGPMAATAALSAAAVGDLAGENTNMFVQLTITMALTVGIAALVAGFLRLGFLASFISEPVMKGSAVPGSLVAVLGGIAAVHLFHLDRHGVEIVGNVESGLPAFGLPDVGLSDYLNLAPAALGAMLIGFAEGLGAAKTYAARDNYEIDANRELLGVGAASLGAGSRAAWSPPAASPRPR